MEELQNVSIHHTASTVIESLQSMQQYEDILQKVQKLSCDPVVDKDNMRASLEETLRKSGVETEIRNLVFHLVRNKFQTGAISPRGLTSSVEQPLLPCSFNIPAQNPVPVSTGRKTAAIQKLTAAGGEATASASSQSVAATTNDELTYLKRAGVQWERRVRKSLNAMCNDLKISIQGQNRDSCDREELNKKWEELSNYVVDLSSFRPVYAPKDLLEVLLSLKGPSAKPGAEKLPEDEVRINDCIDIPPWEFSHIELKVKNFNELRKFYSDILRHESYNSATTGSLDINEQCKRVLEANHAPLCQHLLQKGNIPATYRGALWMQVLNSHVSDSTNDYWQRLRNIVLTTDHIVDKLIFKDIQLTASNDDQYFVFEDVLYQLMLCFSRDTQIPALIPCEPHANTKGRHYEMPPSGIIPFHGICMFAAPFCYLYNSINALYFTFRAFYTRYCQRLTTINVHPQGIVSLCLLFERLLQGHEAALWMHFRDLDIKPIRVVFKWIMRAFSGHLPPDQLLILWDLILGYDSLEIVPLFAVIVLSFRKESILQVSSLECIEAILADLSSIKVMPLIQLTLSRD